MLQGYKYRFLIGLRNKSQLFWSLLFPLILGTFFHIAFGSIMENTENFTKIPVAVVTQDGSQSAEYFTQMVSELSAGEDAVIDPQYVDIEEARKLLSQDKVDGIFDVSDDVKLVVMDEGLNQSILKTISDSYMQTFSTIGNIAAANEALVEKAMADITGDIQINREITLGKGETDNLLSYYNALMAMTCFFACFFAFINIRDIQANTSPLGARRGVCPVRKISMILSDWLAAVTLQFLMAMVTLAYLTFILGVSFGEQWLFIILTCLAGCITGASFGTLIAATVVTDKNLAYGILLSSSLVLCGFSGLYITDIKVVIDRYIPLLNKINPVNLLADAFYCLMVYDNYYRYAQNLIGMLIISAVLCVISAFILRRKRYASI